MNNLYLDTLSLLSASLHGRKKTDISADNWPDIFRELQAHAVVSIVASNVVYMPLSAEQKIAFMKILGRSFQNFNNIVIDQNKILSSLCDAGVNVAILKGTAAAKYYPIPEYRAMGDIDILVNPIDFDKSYGIIKNLGFVPVPDEDKNERHIGFSNERGLEIELHRFFSRVGTKEQQEYFDRRLYSALGACVDCFLPEVENGLVLIGHVAQHLRSGLGLRQIIDWMLYAETNLTDEFWNSEFSIPAQKCGFAKLAKVTTAACRKYLGFNLDVTWCDGIDSSLVDSFMDYIMDQGNFGRKQESDYRNTATVMNNFRNPIALFKYLQTGGKVHWKLARKNKFVGCFAWLYQIVHVIRMGITRRIGVNSLIRSNKESRNIVKLMDELDIQDY